MLCILNIIFSIYLSEKNGKKIDEMTTIRVICHLLLRSKMNVYSCTAEVL